MIDNRRRRAIRSNITGLLFITPNLLGFLVFTFIPVIFSLFVSFTKWDLFKGLSGIQFTGLANYAGMFSDVWFLDSIKNNAIYTVGTIPVILILALGLSIILNDRVYGRSAFRVMYFLPYISNVVAVSAVWMMLYSPSTGPINELLHAIGVANPPKWIASFQWALPSVMIMAVWGGLGYNTVIYLAGLQGIPEELYEAAYLEGAGTLARVRRITIPLLSPTTFFLLITDIIFSFQVFGQINIMTQGGPGRATTVIAYYIYIAGFRFFKMGYAASMAWFLFAAIFIITLVQWRGQKRWVSFL